MNLLDRLQQRATRALIRMFSCPFQAREENFYRSRAWLDLRYRVLRRQGRVCACCGSRKGPWHVDHVRPRSKYPLLSLDEANLQVLCEACNLGKSNKFEDDFRKE